MNTSRLHRLASKLSHERVPPTCPAVHSAGVSATSALHHWLNEQPWHGRLSRKERKSLETRLGDFTADLLDGYKDAGTRVLRDAHVREIEDHLRLNLSAERVAAIEAGEDVNVSALFPSETSP